LHPLAQGVCFLVDEIQKFQKRQTAYKIRIKDILNSMYIKREGFNPNYLEISGKKISRVNVIGVVVQKSVINNFKTVVVDDGSGEISARIFENDALLENIQIGNVILVIGRPREFASEKYVLIEIIKKIETDWAKVRKLELNLDIKTANIDFKSERLQSEIVIESPKNKIIKLIKTLDEGEGVLVENIPVNSNEDIDKIVSVLLKEGDVFEVKPGKLKVLE